MAKKRKAAKRAVSAGKPKGPVKRSSKAAMSVATNARRTAGERVAAMTEAPLAVCESDENLQSMLSILRDVNEPKEVRLGALQSLQAASFSVVAFESCRSEYIATLRKIASDKDPEIRQRVLGTLAREKDGFAQKKLLEGLRNTDKALVPPEKALQLLGYDVHADAYKIARDIVNKPPNPVARREALRLLAADATAAPVFEKILLDKNESQEIRQISASALHSLKPDKLQAHAREILLDKSEPDEIRATSLTALAQFGDQAGLAQDEALMKSVEDLSDKASTRVKKSARAFLSKHGR